MQTECVLMTRLQEFFVIFVFILAVGLIFFMPVFIALFRGLSNKKTLGVFFATLMGLWVAGFLLAFLLEE